MLSCRFLLALRASLSLAASLSQMWPGAVCPSRGKLGALPSVAALYKLGILTTPRRRGVLCPPICAAAHSSVIPTFRASASYVAHLRGLVGGSVLRP